jgi:hypothetical protein
VASKQQTTALFLSTIVTRTRRHTELAKQNWQTWWDTYSVSENIQFSFWCSVFTQLNCTVCGPGSSVGIAIGYGLDGPGIESRWGARFFAHVQTGPEAHPASCTMGTGSFPGVKRPGRGADHQPTSSAEVKKEYSYTSTHPLGHFRPVTGWLYLTFT